MPQYEFNVSLRISHPEMKAAWITEKLSITPDYSYDVGSDRVSVKGRPLGGKHDMTGWMRYLTDGKMDAEDQLFEDFISEQNLKLSAHKGFFFDVTKAGGEVQYFVGWFSTGTINMSLVLSTDLMRSTADLGIGIIMCAYP